MPIDKINISGNPKTLFTYEIEVDDYSGENKYLLGEVKLYEDGHIGNDDSGYAVPIYYQTTYIDNEEYAKFMVYPYVFGHCAGVDLEPLSGTIKSLYEVVYCLVPNAEEDIDPSFPIIENWRTIEVGENFIEGPLREAYWYVPEDATQLFYCNVTGYTYEGTTETHAGVVNTAYGFIDDDGTRYNVNNTVCRKIQGYRFISEDAIITDAGFQYNGYLGEEYISPITGLASPVYVEIEEGYEEVGIGDSAVGYYYIPNIEAILFGYIATDVAGNTAYNNISFSDLKLHPNAEQVTIAGLQCYGYEFSFDELITQAGFMYMGGTGQEKVSTITNIYGQFFKKV